MLVQAHNCLSEAGHFDELRGHLAHADQDAAQVGLSRPWQQFFSLCDAPTADDMDQRLASLQRQIRDNGVTYNVYADQEGPQRPWSLDLFPLLLDAPAWAQIETGVLQRVRLLEAVLADVYGPQQFLQRGLLPGALVHGHPGYLRGMHGVVPAGGVHLHVAAFDITRGPDGLWWLVGQRTQAPSGLGYLLENRLAVSRQFPQAFQNMQVQRLAATYRALMESLRAYSPAGAQAHLALMTPGPYNETYFEHAYLARYLGLTLVEGSDLMVRDERLYLKTLQGLVPIHGLLKRVDDPYLDPLELRPDSTLGVPGLLQAVRAGNVLVANAPGSAFVESPALLGFLPALARHVLGEELSLPALPTWWCGEHSAMEQALTQLAEHTIKPTYPGSPLHENYDPVIARHLDRTQREAWAERIRRQGEEHTVQAFMPLSQMPTWQGPRAQRSGHMAARSTLLRVFAVSDGRDARGQPRWRVLPGGLARVAGTQVDIASMQRGGSSADVWVQAATPAAASSSPPGPVQPASLSPRRSRFVTSRAAENLFWLGRYTERTENAVRLARLTLECLGGEQQNLVPLQRWLLKMAVSNTLVPADVPSAVQARHAFERALVAGLGAHEGATSVGFSLQALKTAASHVRERLSQEHWSAIVRCEDTLRRHCQEHAQRGDFPVAAALRVLKTCSEHLAAITGGQTDRMTRDDGWRLLSIGRHIERLAFLAGALEQALELGTLETEGGFEAVLDLFDSTITFRAQYQQSRDMAALCELLVMDPDNPRSLAWVARTLRGRLARLAGSPAGVLCPLALKVPDPEDWDFSDQRAHEADLLEPLSLLELLRTLRACAYAVSDEVSASYFTHSGETKQSLGS